MNIFEKHNQGLNARPNSDTYHEQWVAGTYIVAGVFQRKQALISIQDIQAEVPRLFELLKVNKKSRWPKGICGYYAIPIYICDVLNLGAADWVHSRPKYRYAIWHEPILYDRVRNVAEMNQAWEVYGSAFRVFLFEVIFTALEGLAKKEGHTSFPQVNGERIIIQEQGQPTGVDNAVTRRI
jgi:hypothetical protein